MNNKEKIFSGVKSVVEAMLVMGVAAGVTVACCSTRKQSGDATDGKAQDSLRKEIPHQPPVVIPHSWQEEMK